MSEFEIFKVKMDIRTRPYFDFSIDKYKSGLTEFVFTSSPDFYFLIGKKKSGHVRISISKFERTKSGLTNFFHNNVILQSGFNFLHLKMKIWTRPDFLFFNWKQKIRTRPDFNFSIGEKKIRTNKICSLQYHNSHKSLVWIFRCVSTSRFHKITDNRHLALYEFV